MTHCGCKIVTDPNYTKVYGPFGAHDPDVMIIEFCAMHKAAPEMLEALKREHDALTDHFRECEKDCETCATLRAAEGKSPSR